MKEKKLQPKFESQIDQQYMRVFVFTTKPPMCDGGAKKFQCQLFRWHLHTKIEMKLFTCVSANRNSKMKMWYEFHILYWDVSRWNIYVQNKRDSHHVCATFFCFCYFSWQFWRMYKYISLEIHEIIVFF